MYGYN